MDPNSSGCGVRQFKTYLLHKLEMIGQACSPLLQRRTALWDSFVELARAYDSVMGFLIFLPVAILSWIPFIAECHTRLLFNQTYVRGVQISRVLAGQDTEEF